ncbi:hypothetical protein HYN59_13535 [Flavobacterium album]|uniref:DUF7684 domain-containing protein n=1 Tax=Flavobacterium album TaxID=2175091 RepID=A0A2S1R085_9FLAO|nr:hypothetical protein [Flavobacterium album]AWH86070.1 hypothetical protein HYN59_13535 [Flavobacterium album]
MKLLSTYNNQKVCWIDYADLPEQLPANNWICLAIANNVPDDDIFEAFVNASVANGLLEFKAWGKYGELLHDNFDSIVSFIEVMEGHPKIEVVTTWHNDQSLADVFWQCFFATSLPENVDLNNLTVVCTDLDGIDRSNELEEHIGQFKQGWLPE